MIVTNTVIKKMFDLSFKRCWYLLILFCSAYAEPGKLSFASYYSDGMVLQQAPSKAMVWGYSAASGDVVKVTVSTGPTYTVTSAPYMSGGVWEVFLDPQSTHGPVSVKATSGETKVELQDVLFGDVWICSGQSNMEFTLDMAFNASGELADAVNYSELRVFTATKKQSDKPEADLLGIDEQWSVPSRDSLGHKPWTYFSAVCWLYGKYLHQRLNYPIGLIASSWGGTAIELWSSPDVLRQCNVRRSVRSGSGIAKSSLWNAMMHPFTKMTIKGAIWYQGEANAAAPDSYKCTFPTMIDDWRQKFNAANNETNKQFPFGFVQLAGYRNDPTIKTGFPDIRWHQTADYGQVPNPRMNNVFMGVAMDLPDFQSPYGSVHPRDKQDAAARLALSGLSVAYGLKLGRFQGPRVSAFYADIGYFTLGLEFDNRTTTLNVRSANGFELCCSRNNQSKCDGSDSVWMETPIIKHDDHMVTLSYNGTCSNQWIMGLRYAWRESPCLFKQCAVYLKENDIPLEPMLNLGLLSKDARYRPRHH